ncbi:hypothetical protein ACFQXB_06165, partial [Plastorhodobacter daqingensis]
AIALLHHGKCDQGARRVPPEEAQTQWGKNPAYSISRFKSIIDPVAFSANPASAPGFFFVAEIDLNPFSNRRLLLRPFEGVSPVSPVSLPRIR